MKASKRLLFLQVLTLALILLLVGFQFRSLRILKAHVATGLTEAVQDIAQETGQQIHRELDKKLRQEIIDAGLVIQEQTYGWQSLDENRFPAMAHAFRIEWMPADEMWRLHEMTLSRRQPFAGDEQFILNQLNYLLDYRELNPEKLWLGTVDSSRYFFQAGPSWGGGEEWVLRPYFREVDRAWLGYIAVKLDQHWVYQKFLPDFFAHAFWPDDSLRQDGIRKEFLRVRVRESQNSRRFDLQKLSSGKIEARYPLRYHGGLLSLATLEMGFQGTDAASIAASLHRRNLLLLGAVLLVLIGLIWFIFAYVRKAHRLAQLKTDFVANVSHQLKTPLSGLRLAGETLAQGRFSHPEQSQELGDLIQTEATHLQEQLTYLLNFSRLESHGHPFELQDFSPEDWWKKSLEQFGPRIQAQNRRFHPELRSYPASLQADPIALRQALWALLDNAIKYSPPGSAISLRAFTDEKQWMIEVQDEGSGIPDTERQRIFDKFTRLGDPDTREVGGYGLGLAMVRDRKSVV